MWRLKRLISDKPLGIRLQFDEENEVVFINEIVNSKMSTFQVGVQILEINKLKSTSVKDLIHILSRVGTGNYIDFSVKRIKESTTG